MGIGPVTVPSDLYRNWRERGGSTANLQDAPTKALPPERWLQELWAHQRVRRNALRTADDQPVVVLHPGFWNREAGPDFLRAVIQVGNQSPVSGDVEIDLHSSGWKSHGHAGNAAYANVILHVVWEAPTQPPILPTLALRPFLDAPVEELQTWGGGRGEIPAEWLEGQCCAPLRELPREAIEEILRQAALVRLRTKSFAFRARAKEAGWHQALWEGMFRSLGYKHNAWPMQRLAELLPIARATPFEPREAREGWEARLLGLSGLLPADPRKGTRARRLWDRWWRERATYDEHILPPALWRLNGVRPANHPQRRIALAAAWVASESWESKLEAWFQTRREAPDAEEALLELLRPEPDGFWRRHYTLISRELPDAPPLLGAGRVNDLAVNALLPWFHARAEAGNDTALATQVEQLYLDWPAGEDNTTLKLARARLFGAEAPELRRRAANQQGILQVVRDFCSHSNAICEGCRFPGLVAPFRIPA